jgi:hypothetical protein
MIGSLFLVRSRCMAAKAKVRAFRFTDEEIALLNVIQGHTGIQSRTEALRTVLRYYVEGEGLEGQPRSTPRNSRR